MKFQVGRCASSPDLSAVQLLTQSGHGMEASLSPPLGGGNAVATLTAGFPVSAQVAILS